uniref:Fibronectin type-III domain-containing protein n=2 Tax=Photinus pyralis TaxID=7054 RepID=A0A1Y1NJ44_PHOPY
MKDSQQMSVDISSQNEMALSALPPVSLKEANNIYRVDSIVPDENYHLNLTDDDENAEKKSAVPDTSQESEDDILNKFESSESDEPITNGCPETDDKLEDRLLNDCIDTKEESVNNTEVSDDRDLNNKKSVFSESDEPDLNEKKDVDTETNDTETKATDDHDNKMVADTTPNDIETEKAASDEDEKKEESEDVEMKEDTEAKQKNDEMKEDSEAKQKEDAEMKEKANAELLKDQILDTEDLLQIVDQQDTADEPNENSCSGENTPDKEESDEAETDKNDDEEDTSTSKNDDDTVDIEEDSPYKGDFDSELDKEYEKIVNEKENEESNEKAAQEKMEDDVGEKTVAPEEKTAEESMEVTEKTEEQTDETSDETKSSGIETKAQTENSDAVDATLKTKRSLSEPDTIVEPKRLRLEDENSTNEDQKSTVEEKSELQVEKPLPTVTELTAISEYMQKKSLKRLTREDLEQICLMKMCEAICHKSEIGELRHQLSIQEQMVDMWRKEAAALVKQARDLEIVNKRLLHEVRLKTDKEKPLIPVRITRSVGLQVRSDNNVMYNAMQTKRRFARPTTTAPAPPQKQVQSRFNQNKSPATGKTIVNKTVAASPNKQASASKPKPLTPKTPNSLLSKALQNSTAQAAANSSTNTTTVSSTVAPPLASISNTSTTSTSPATTKSISNASPKTGKPTETKAGVIDLTDEDEKKPSVSSATTTTVNTTQGVRIVSTPVKNTSTVSSGNVVNPPRIMYLYNNQLHQGVITDSPKGGPQKVMFKLNSNVIGQANGVLTAVTSGSPISVSNGTVRTSQVQSVRFSSPTTTVRTSASTKAVAKHPAPLPPPPITQIGLAARKPIPPKPHLSIRRSSGGIVLSWKMPYILDNYEAIASYQLYAYQETTSAPSSDMWRKVGDVKALALPMACTLTQFADGNKYHFAVRAVDVQKRMGPFSDPEQILL